MQKTKLLFSIGYYSTGGKERQLTEIITHLSPERYEIGLIYSKGDAHFLEKTLPYVTRKYDISILNILSFIRSVLDFKPHILCCLSRPTSYFAVVAYLVGKLFKVNFALLNMSIQGAPIDVSFIQRIEGLIYKIFPFVVANTKAGLLSYGQSHQKNRFVLYNGFSFDRVPNMSKSQARLLIQQELSVEQTDFILTMVAGLKNSKDHTTLLKGVELFNKTYPDKAKLLLVGEGPNRKRILEYVEQSNLQRTVLLLGNRSDVEVLLKASDLSVLCSTNGEGIANVILESLACGTPVVATFGGGTPEIITEGENGYLVKRKDSTHLFETLKYLYEHQELISNMSLCCVETAKKFNVSNMVSSFEKIVETVLKRYN